MIEDKLSIKEILDILPHRYPFLLIDSVLKRVRSEDLKNWENAYLIARKNITINEPFFVGHFPNNPIMPGVLQIEAMAQAAAILVLKPNSNNSTLITGVDKAKFRAPVVPGDILNIEAKVVKIRSDRVYIFETNICKEDGSKVSEARLTAYFKSH